MRHATALLVLVVVGCSDASSTAPASSSRKVTSRVVDPPPSRVVDPPPTDAAPPAPDPFAAPRTVVVVPTWRSPPPTATYQLHVSANASWKRGDVVETARREWYAAIDRKSRTATLILDYRDMERTIAQAGKPVETIPSPLRKTYLKLDAATLKSGRPLEEREIIQRDADDVLRDRAGLSGIYVDRTWRGGEPRDLDRDALAILERELKRLLPGVRVERAKLGVRSEMLGKQATFHLELAIADEGTAAITLGGELTVSILDGQALELELEGPGASIRVAWQTATF